MTENSERCWPLIIKRSFHLICIHRVSLHLLLLLCIAELLKKKVCPYIYSLFFANKCQIRAYVVVIFCSCRARTSSPAFVGFSLRTFLNQWQGNTAQQDRQMSCYIVRLPPLTFCHDCYQKSILGWSACCLSHGKKICWYYFLFICLDIRFATWINIEILQYCVLCNFAILNTSSWRPSKGMFVFPVGTGAESFPVNTDTKI